MKRKKKQQVHKMNLKVLNSKIKKKERRNGEDNNTFILFNLFQYFHLKTDLKTDDC